MVFTKSKYLQLNRSAPPDSPLELPIRSLQYTSPKYTRASSMATEEHVQSVLEEYVAAYNDHDVEKIKSLMSEEIVVEVNGVEVQSNREEVLASVTDFFESHPEVEIDEIQAADDGGTIKFKGPDGDSQWEAEFAFDEEGLIIKQAITR
jgi:ketosteroid isomerase-like protein